MGMVLYEHPRITGSLSLGQEFCQAIEKIFSIPVVYEYLSTLYPPDHDVMQHTGRVQPSLPWHGIPLPHNPAHHQLIFLPASPFTRLKIMVREVFPRAPGSPWGQAVAGIHQPFGPYPAGFGSYPGYREGGYVAFWLAGQGTIYLYRRYV